MKKNKITPFQRSQEEITAKPKHKKAGFFKGFISVGCASLLFFSLGLTASYVIVKKKKFQLACNDLTKINYSSDNRTWPTIAGYKPVHTNNFDFYFDRQLAEKRRLLKNWEEDKKGYKKEKGKFGVFLNQEHKNKELIFRVKTTKYVIAHASRIQSLYTKCCAINGFVNMTIGPDREKIEKRKAGTYKEPWCNTPQKTIEKGKGVCVDYSALKAEMLIQCGVPKEKIYFLSLKISKAYHEALGIHTKYGMLVLDSIRLRNSAPLRKLYGAMYSHVYKPYFTKNYFSKETGNMLICATDMNGINLLYKFTKETEKKATVLVYSTSQEDHKHFEAIELVTSLLFAKRTAALIAAEQAKAKRPSSKSTVGQINAVPSEKGFD